MRPGQPGTKRLLAKYGKSLVCVRYRYDEQAKHRIKTVELIADRTEWRLESGSSDGDTVVALRVGWREYEVQEASEGRGGQVGSRSPCVALEPPASGEAGAGESYC